MLTNMMAEGLRHFLKVTSVHLWQDCLCFSWELLNLNIYINDYICILNRQCALVALQDVKAYFNEEGGQIAVSFFFFLPHLITLM